jgi:hypothetical protein
MNIELHIDELTLHGFTPEHRNRIGNAIELELTRLIREKGLSGIGNNDVHVPQLNGGSFTMGANVNTSGAGTEIARSVFGSLAAGLTITPCKSQEESL